MDERLALAVDIIEGKDGTTEAPACSVLEAIFWPKAEKNSEQRKLEYQGSKNCPLSIGNSNHVKSEQDLRNL